MFMLLKYRRKCFLNTRLNACCWQKTSSFFSRPHFLTKQLFCLLLPHVIVLQTRFPPQESKTTCSTQYFLLASWKPQINLNMVSDKFLCVCVNLVSDTYKNRLSIVSSAGYFFAWWDRSNTTGWLIKFETPLFLRFVWTIPLT